MNRKIKVHTSKTAVIFALILLAMVLVITGCAQKPAPTSTEGTTTTTNTTTQEGTAATNTGAGTAATQTNAVAKVECAECHEMWPEIATWQTSVHAKVACTVCHKGYQNGQNKGTHDSGAFAKPIRLKSEMTDEACKSCHSMENRTETLLPDLIAPHAKHAAGKVSCLSCHRFTTHGNIAERKVTTRAEYSDYSQWNAQMAKKAAPGVMRRPNMFVCIACHEQRKVTTKCAACHYFEDRKTLPSHEDPAWKATHGKAGRADVNNCAKCHYDKESQKFATPSTGDLIADFARANSYCYGCHLKRPYNHDGQWMAKHPGMATQRGYANCFACHDRNQPGANVTGTYCNTCHWFAVPAAPKQ